MWPIQLHDKLPVLPVPLIQPDPDVALDLGAMVASVYERGGYDLVINYRESPPPAPSATPESPEMAAGKKLFQLKCCGCHDVPSPSRVEEGTWTRWMMKMRGKAKLTDAEYDQIMDYARRAREAYMLKMMR